MTKFAILMYLCTTMTGIGCQMIETDIKYFKDEYDCVHYGYKHSVELVEKFGREDVNKLSLYTKFVCTPINVTES